MFGRVERGRDVKFQCICTGLTIYFRVYPVCALCFAHPNPLLPVLTHAIGSLCRLCENS